MRSKIRFTALTESLPSLRRAGVPAALSNSRSVSRYSASASRASLREEHVALGPSLALHPAHTNPPGCPQLPRDVRFYLPEVQHDQLLAPLLGLHGGTLLHGRGVPRSVLRR